jgi:hypothetical protein
VRMRSGGWPGRISICLLFLLFLTFVFLFPYSFFNMASKKEELQLFLTWVEFSTGRASHSQGTCGHTASVTSYGGNMEGDYFDDDPREAYEARTRYCED